MNKHNYTLLITSLICSILSFSLHANNRKQTFNDHWKFHRGSVANAEQENYSDSKWRTLDLPHDWSVEPAPIQLAGVTVGPFSKLNESGAGGADTGQTLGGEGWYRKQFTINATDADKLFTLYFEGVYNQSEVYVNGQKVYFNPCGYTSYKLDITAYCHPAGEPNTIAVRAVNVGQNSRWYSGSGIYRPVWLIKTPKTHLEKWDTYVDASTVVGNNCTVNFATIIHHKDQPETNATLHVKILSPEGKEVASVSENILLKESTPIALPITISRARLWSINTPTLYRAEISIAIAEKEVDQITIPFGIRTLEFSAEKGFLLNGIPTLLKGGCIHHDNGLLGATALNRAEEKKVELLKSNGYNAVRCAHNQISESFLDACDRLGMLVIHETFDQWQKAKRADDYHQYFDECSDKDLIASVRRDRNHPSIIMWSIGNEIEQRADIPQGEEIAKRLTATIKKYDTARFSTVGANDFWDRAQFTWAKDAYRAFNQVDVAGYNYMYQAYEEDLKTDPKRVIYGSESYPKDANLNWNLVEKHTAVIGDFVWTAIDYIGEAGLGHVSELAEGEQDPQFMGWPWYNAWCGDIDLCGDKKPQSYYRDIVWREREITMAVTPPVAAGKREVVNGWGWYNELLHWSWAGLEGQNMRVNVYSRAPKVRLYLNGVLIGEKETGAENYAATFEVPYQAGELKAVNLSGKKEKAAVVFKTANKPANIKLTADRNPIRVDKSDLSYVKIELLDQEGVLVPNHDLNVTIEYTGNGAVIASGNGAPDDMESFRSLTPKTYRGKAIAIVQPTEQGGEIQLTVSANGLPSATLTIKVGL